MKNKNLTDEEKISAFIDKEFDGDTKAFLSSLEKIKPEKRGRPKNPREEDVYFYTAIKLMTIFSKPAIQPAIRKLQEIFTRFRNTAANMEQSSTPFSKKITIPEVISTLIESGDYPIKNTAANMGQGSTLFPKKLTIPDAISILIKSGDFPTATPERFEKKADTSLKGEQKLKDQLLDLYKQLQKEEGKNADWLEKTDVV